MSLTPKQEIFIGRLVEGYSQREAYKFAYNAEKMKDETIDTKASMLFKEDKIRRRYDELRNEIKEKTFYTVEQANKELEWFKSKVIEDIESKGIKQANSSAFMSAIKQQIELNGITIKDSNKELAEGINIKIIKASERDE